MAWTVLTFPFGSILTSAKMTQMYDNFTAFARGQTGAPKVTYTGSTSGIISDFYRRFGDGELGEATITANTAMVPGIYNFTTITVNSGITIKPSKPGPLIFRCTSAFNLYGVIDCSCAGGTVSEGDGYFGGVGGGVTFGGAGGSTLGAKGVAGVGVDMSDLALAVLRENPMIGFANNVGDVNSIALLGGGAGSQNVDSGSGLGVGGGIFISISDVFDTTSAGQILCDGRGGVGVSGAGGGGASVRCARVFSSDIGSYSSLGGVTSGLDGGDGVALKIVLE